MEPLEPTATEQQPGELEIFELVYQGPDVEDGTMGARELAEVLTGVSRAFSTVASDANLGDRYQLRIKDVESNSFHTVLEAIEYAKSNPAQATALIAGAAVTLQGLTAVVSGAYSTEQPLPPCPQDGMPPNSLKRQKAKETRLLTRGAFIQDVSPLQRSVLLGCSRLIVEILYIVVSAVLQHRLRRLIGSCTLLRWRLLSCAAEIRRRNHQNRRAVLSDSDNSVENPAISKKTEKNSCQPRPRCGTRTTEIH
jgi:hypothetical protein